MGSDNIFYENFVGDVFCGKVVVVYVVWCY